MSLGETEEQKERNCSKINYFLRWVMCFEFEGMGNLWLLQIEPSRRLR
jgi:hypothetical protein